ncbi:RDD family protein [Symmachiella macrocystis]|uniref:RDD family protein n=1 Tax=Symmachiella macrocystis TaxID=2527985 RepID=A0A5C6BFY1_9PLAN|nr:RDD family protein [Symmachiella macrocystis]TWU09344.1 RDD family protein [Symmachiella macrocystis]
MSIEFHCPGCDKLLSTSDERAGWQAQCPQCSTLVTVPLNPDTPAVLDPVVGPTAPAVGDTTPSDGSCCPMCGAAVYSVSGRCAQCGERFGVDAAESAKRDLVYAGFGVRFLAFLIDYVIAGLIPGIAIGALLEVGDFAGDFDDPADETWFISMILGFVVDWLYHAVMESSSLQATLGKMAMRLIVTDTEGRRITFWRATGRAFAKILSGMMCSLGYILAAFTERHQALHDMICGTLVVRA